VKALNELGKGIWESMPTLAAIFLQKEGETFSEELISGDSERIKLMYELPMDIALSVAFFLQSSMSLYTNNLASSILEEQKELI
jgi:hypothetical protein